MSDTTTDHAATIRRLAGAIFATLPDELREHQRACEDIREHADALVAERDALRAYAREAETILHGVNIARHGREIAEEMRAAARDRNGVAAIMADN